MRAEAGTLRHYGTCLFTDAETGRQCRVRIAHYERDGRFWLEGDFDGAHAEPREVRPETFRWWRANLFPDNSPTRREPATVTGIDGAPVLSEVQETIRRLRAKRDQLRSIIDRQWEAVAAD